MAEALDSKRQDHHHPHPQPHAPRSAKLRCAQRRFNSFPRNVLSNLLHAHCSTSPPRIISPFISPFRGCRSCALPPAPLRRSLGANQRTPQASPWGMSVVLCEPVTGDRRPAPGPGCRSVFGILSREWVGRYRLHLRLSASCARAPLVAAPRAPEFLWILVKTSGFLTTRETGSGRLFLPYASESAWESPSVRRTLI